MENIIQGFDIFRKRIEPAKLVESQKNANTLGAACVANGNNLTTMTPQQVADALYTAANSIANQLQWEIKPKKLTGNQDHNTTPRTARKEAEEFAVKTKKEEEAREYAKTQEAAARSIASLIDAVQFKDSSGTRVAHGKTEEVKTRCKAHLSKALAGNRDLRLVHKELAKYVAGEYEKAEKAQERL